MRDWSSSYFPFAFEEFDIPFICCNEELEYVKAFGKGRVRHVGVPVPDAPLVSTVTLLGFRLAQGFHFTDSPCWQQMCILGNLSKTQQGRRILD